MVKKDIFIDASSDGIRMSVAVCESEESPKAVLQIVHGMCEHKERYLPMIEYLCSKGYACVIPDLRGHGASVSSTDQLGDMGKGGFEGMIEDQRIVTLWCRDNYPGIKVFLFGHSMGSMVVRCYCRKHDDLIDGLIVCGSPSRNGAAPLAVGLARIVWMFNGWKYRSSFLQKLSTGSYGRKFRKEGSPNAWICTDKAVVKAYDEDPLCGFPFTVNGYFNLFKLMQQTYSEKGWEMKHKDLPIFFIAGAEDPCIGSLNKFSEAVNSMRSHGYTDISSKVYPKVRHEIHNETIKQEVWDDIALALDTWNGRA